MSDINTTPVKAGTTNAAKKKITAKNLKADDFVNLLRSIDAAIFETDGFSICHMAMCDAMVQYFKLHYYYPDDFNKGDDESFIEFFNDLYDGKYKDYISAMDKTETAKLIDDAVKIRKQIAISRLQSPLTETLSKINEILNTFTEEFKGIEPDSIKKFISDFANFSQKNNPETLTSAMLNKKKAEG